jgi:hypothetical protein
MLVEVKVPAKVFVLLLEKTERNDERGGKIFFVFFFLNANYSFFLSIET